jgi:peptidyl-prolyl cis-trans isomerase NIMA-interacting 1
MSSLPQGWEERLSKSHAGRSYYVNKYTGETTWDLPTEPAMDNRSKLEQVQCLHILKKHAGSRRPSSWRCTMIIQSKEESVQQITRIRAQLEQILSQQGYEAMLGKFKEIAAVESDCSSAERGGDLGKFGRGQMQRAFEEASFSLGVQGLSGIVDTDSGIHVILRIA